MNSPVFHHRQTRFSPVVNAIISSVLLFFIGTHTAIAAVTVAQSPLFISLSGVDPNLMLILDDSGSMQSEIMPESYTNLGNGDAFFMFPHVANTYDCVSGGGYTCTADAGYDFGGDAPNPPSPLIPTSTTGTNAYGAMMRASAINTVYYNPAITYSPWKKYDGTTYPAASSTCALHNPERSGTGNTYCIDLTGSYSTSTTTSSKTLGVNTTWYKCNTSASCGSGSSSTTTATSFPIATYYYYKGPKDTSGNPTTTGMWTYNSTNYEKVSIVLPTTTTYSGHGETARTDCTAGSCTYAQEIQNFANWYTYYRSRILAVRAGVGRALSTQSSSLRIGFGTINQTSQTVDGATNTTIVKGVRPFTGTAKQAIYENLYKRTVPPSNPNFYTPLRRALDAAGLYYSRTDNQSPWATDPSQNVTATMDSCRRSYTVLMTDGYWNNAAATTTAATANVDNSVGPTITYPNSTSPTKSYTYGSATLDPKTGLVSPYKDSNSNTLADVAMYYWNRDLNTNLANDVPTSTIDPAFWQHMVTFGVSLGMSGTISPTAAFAAINSGASITWPAPSTSGTTANIDDLLHAAVNSRGGFFSAANPDSFATQLTDLLEEIVARDAISSTALASNSTQLQTSTAVYQASFNTDGWSGVLNAYPLNTNGTFGAATWSTDTTGKIPAYTSGSTTRKIFTKTSTLTPSCGTALSGLTVNQTKWICGDQSNESPNGALLRKRSRTSTSSGASVTTAHLMGDIANSDPLYVKTTTPASRTYITAAETIYVGANDGMLHAFDALTGVERFAYIPSAVIANLSSLTDPNYSHKYFVDASPVAIKMDDTNETTMLVGSTGAGARSLFGLDISAPVQETQSHVYWEFTNTNDSDLGYVLGRPVLGKLKNGTWVAVFGNGYGSTAGKAYLYVVDLTGGTVLGKFSTSTDTNNGLSEPAILKDDDGRIVAAYAGDLAGKLWKFNLTTVSTSGTAAFSGTPLFIAKDSAGGIQPITSAPVIGRHPNGGYFVFFGTGKYFESSPNTDHSATPYLNGVALGIQSIYGIWDTATFAGTTTGGTWSGGSAITSTNRSTLLQQTITATTNTAGNNWRTVSTNAVSSWGTTTSPLKRGWYLDVPVAGERITDGPKLFGGRVVFMSRIPYSTSKCVPDVGTSWFMALDMLTGGRTTSAVFDVNRDGSFDDSDLVGGSLASGFETIEAGMSKFSLMSFAPGSVSILLSGTAGMTTTADSVSASNGSSTEATNLAKAAQLAATAQAAVTAATAAQAAADAAPNDVALHDAAVAANKAAAQALIDAANAIKAAATGTAAEALLTAIGLTGSTIVSDMTTLISNLAPYLTSGNAIPVGYTTPIGIAPNMQGKQDMGVQMSGLGDARKTWQQLR